MPGNQEYGIEEYEKNSQFIDEEEERIEQKEISLKSAIASIEKDPDINKILENEQKQLQEKKIELIDKKNEIISSVVLLEEEINEHRNQISEEKHNLSFLIEEENELKEIFLDRESYLDECGRRIKQIKEKLSISDLDTGKEFECLYTEQELQAIREIEKEEVNIQEVPWDKGHPKERKLIEPKSSGVFQYGENEKSYLFPNS